MIIRTILAGIGGPRILTRGTTLLIIRWISTTGARRQTVLKVGGTEERTSPPTIRVPYRSPLSGRKAHSGREQRGSWIPVGGSRMLACMFQAFRIKGRMGEISIIWERR